MKANPHPLLPARRSSGGSVFGATAPAAWVALGLIFVPLGASGSPYHIVWGDVHGHTRLSDGKRSLDHYFTYARDTAKLDFVIVSDHDFGHGPPWRMPKADWRLTQEKVDEYTVPGHFIAIAGYEWTSQAKYWTEKGGPEFPGPPMYYNHKNVYFPSRVDYLFSSKDLAYHTPDQLAAAVRKAGGLIQNNHPAAGLEGRDQFDYSPTDADVIVNTEIRPDVMRYRGKTYHILMEQTDRDFLNRGGRTGFVFGSDTHEGCPTAHTAVLVRELTRRGIFEALRHRRNYAVSNARIVLNFCINGHAMGEAIRIEGKPRVEVNVQGTARIKELTVIRDGEALWTLHPSDREARLDRRDNSFSGSSYYYVRVIQADRDADGNPSYAWSSPIWVTEKR